MLEKNQFEVRVVPALREESLKAQTKATVVLNQVLVQCSSGKVPHL